MAILQSEKVTERYLCQRMKEIGCECFKWTSPGVRGVPDRICIFPHGAIYFVELKSEGVKPKAHQLRFAKRLKKVNTPVEFIDTKEEVDNFIKLGGQYDSSSNQRAESN